jgi:hypothetical protein
MRRMSRRACGLAIAVAWLGCACAGLLRADDDDDLVEIRPEVQRQMLQGKIRISARNIDAWIYGNQASGRERLDASLVRKIAELARGCGLSDDQKQKLSLAGKGDIQRFVSRVNDLKAKWESEGIPRDQFNAMYQETRPLHAALQQGLFESGSLYEKTLITTLKPAQVARYRQTVRERRAYRYRARVELVVAQLDAILGLRDAQRTQLVQLLLDKTRAPRTFGQFDRFVVLTQMDRLPDETLKPLFEPGQWRVLQRELATARRMLPVLKQNGVIFDEGEEPTDEAAEFLRPRKGG